MRVLAPFLVTMVLDSINPAVAQSPSVRAGLHVEHNSSNQPGFLVSLDHPRILRRHPRLTLSYSTTRLAAATGNELVKDRIVLAAGWYFRPLKRLDPYVELQMGYARFNRESEAIFALLDNDAPLISLLVGLETRWLKQRLGVFVDMGASILSSSTVYPFVASMGVTYRLNREVDR